MFGSFPNPGGAPPTVNITILAKFSGVLVQQPADVGSTFLSDVGELAVPAAYINDGVPQSYGTSSRTIERLRVTSKSGTGGTAMDVTLYKNATGAPGVGATAMTVHIPGGTAPGTVFLDAAHPITFADGDTFDVVASMGAGVGDGPYFLSASLEGPL